MQSYISMCNCHCAALFEVIARTFRDLHGPAQLINRVFRLDCQHACVTPQALEEDLRFTGTSERHMAACVLSSCQRYQRNIRIRTSRLTVTCILCNHVYERLAGGRQNQSDRLCVFVRRLSEAVSQLR